MNENLDSEEIINPPPIIGERTSPKFTRATVPLESPLYEEIESLLSELSNHIGSRVNMPAFLRKTIIENWKIQMERYRKLNPSSKQTRS